MCLLRATALNLRSTFSSRRREIGRVRERAGNSASGTGPDIFLLLQTGAASQVFVRDVVRLMSRLMEPLVVFAK